MAKTNIEILRVSDKIHRDEKGFYTFLTIRSFPVTRTSVKAYITDEDDLAYVRRLYREEDKK